MFTTIILYLLVPTIVLGSAGLIVLWIFILATRQERTPISHSDADTLHSGLPSSRESAVSTKREARRLDSKTSATPAALDPSAPLGGRACNR
ncbi:MAG: hypothetical protein U0992_15700 [Planctomycetaceae bacterium]